MRSLFVCAMQPNDPAKFFPGPNREGAMRQFFLNAMEPSIVPLWYGGKTGMRQSFLNALEPSPVGYFNKPLAHRDDEAPQRDPFSVFKAILISYHYWDRWPRIPTERLIVGDSGGFSVATLGARIDPEHVIRWQIKNTDIGYMLDIPPYRNSGTSARAGGRASDWWADSLKRSVDNVRRARQHYDPDSYPFRWWGVCQGEMREQHEEWYDAISAEYAFDGPGEGWAMRPHPNNDPGSIARCVRFAGDKGFKNLHLLQTTGPSAVAILIALGKKAGLEFVTYDSESAARVALSRSILVRPARLPAYSFKTITESSRKGETTVRDYMLSGRCPCVGCSWLKEDELPAGVEYSHYIMVHNYCVMQDNFDAIERAVDNDADAVLRNLGLYGEVMRAFEAPHRHAHAKIRARGILDRIR